jgi:putative endonuclease
MASKTGTLYIGVTSDLEKRIWEHKNDVHEGFTKKYRCHILIYFEHLNDMMEAIESEKEIKKWNRNKKENLIKTINPLWDDLAKDWY